MNRHRGKGPVGMALCRSRRTFIRYGTERKRCMIGVVDVGGGMRGVYGAGIFDWCMDHGISFDYLAGVSAGSANCAAYASGQRGRNYLFYHEYSFRREYMSMDLFLRTGSYLDLEYIYGSGLTNSDGENPLDFEAMLASGKKMKIVATDAKTGEPVYYDMTDMSQDDYGAIKGSSCVPVASKPYEWKGRLLFDGGISDPIPYDLALAAGCEKVVVILTRPKSFRRNARKDELMSGLLARKYPEAARRLKERAYVYNHELNRALELEKEGKLLILAPYSIGNMSTLTKDKEQIDHMYRLGMEDAQKIEGFFAEGAAAGCGG